MPRRLTPKTPKQHLALMLSILSLGGASMTSCAASRTESSAASGDVAAELNSADNVSEQALVNRSQTSLPTDVPRKNPQLIKTANLTIQVTNIESALDQISNILEAQNGDLLSLEDSRPRQAGDRHRSSLRIRVPQDRLNIILEKLEELGNIKNRSIQAQDVSNQLIDNQARLKNLRKSEEMVLKIMDRSGSIPDVLAASTELSTIRENIERIDAQLQSLQSQVAFSTVNLRLESLTTTKAPAVGLGLQLNEAWKKSTSAVGYLTLSFLKLGIWGIAFSPYLIAMGLLIWLGQRTFRKGAAAKKAKAAQQTSNSI